MKRFYKYELLEIVEDGPVTTYSAKEIASGRPVLVHLLTNALEIERRDELLQKARAVAANTNGGESTVLEAGQYVGFRYVVTDIVETSTGFLAWLSELCGESAGVVAGRAQAASAEDDHESPTSASTPGPPPPSEPQVASPDAPQQTVAVARQSGGGDGPAEEDSQQDVETPLAQLSGVAQEFTTDEDEASSPAQSSQPADAAAPAPNTGDTSETAESHGEPQYSDPQPQEQAEAARWFQVARQRIETRAFSEALHALEQVLQLRPNDEEALRLQAEVRRREAESRQNATASAEQAPPVPESPASPTPAAGAESQEEEALLLLSKGQALCDQGRAAEGLNLLRRAHSLDPNNTLVTLVLSNSLMQRATSLGGSDWESVDLLAGELLNLQPSHQAAQSLRRRAAAGAKLHRVSRCHDEAKRMKSQGDLERALEAVAEGLRRDPGEAPLIALQEELQDARDRAPRPLEQAARSSHETANVADGAAPGAATPGTEAAQTPERAVTPRPQEQRAEAVGTSEGGTEVQDLEDIRPSLKGYRRVEREDSAETPSQVAGTGPNDTPSLETKPVAPTPEVPAAQETSTDFSAAKVSHPAEEPEGAKSGQQPRTADRPAVKTKPGTQHRVKVRLATQAAQRLGTALQTCTGRLRQTLQAARRLADPAVAALATSLKDRRRRLWVIGGLAGLLVLAVALMIHQSRDAAAGPPAATYRIQIESQPPGAAISVNGSVCGTSACEADLVAGNHQATAWLAGYMPASLSFAIDPETAQEQIPVVVTLSPLTPVLRISSNVGRGQVLIDGQDAGRFEEGEFELDLASLDPGEHTLRIVERDTAATIPFKAVPGSIPIVVGPIQTRNLKTAVVAGLGEDARIYNSESAQARLGETDVGTVDAQGVPLGGLAEGSHEVSLGMGKDQQRIVFDATPQPTLAAFLNADRNVGSLRILTGEDDVAIYLNGQQYRHKTRRGARLIYLYPKKYAVRIEKNGFQAPAEQVAEVRKGEEVRLTFELAPQPQAATLQLRNSVPGAQVWLDGDPLGTVRPDGGLTAVNIEPGKRHIRIEKQHYKAKQWEQEFAGGAKVEVDGSLESSVGTLQVQVVPENVDVQLKLRGDGAASEQTISETRQFLPPGTYTVTASAEGYQDYGATVRLEINETETVRLVLKPVAAKRVQEPTIQLVDWEKGGGWRREGKLLVRQGGNIVLAPGGSGRGEYIFTATVMRGGELQWVVNYVDGENYLHCSLDKNQFERVQIQDGKRTNRFRTRHGLSTDGFLSVKAQTSADSIVHKVLRGKEWVVIDTFEQPGSAFDQGKFGFRLPGRDQIGLSFFNFMPWE